MYIPFALFLNYSWPCHWWFGPLLQVLGFTCLLATRFTHRLYPVLDQSYYLFSAIIRPVGIILIAWAWMVIFSKNPPPPFLPNIDRSYIVIPLFLFAFVIAIIDPLLRRFSFALLIVFGIAFMPRVILGILFMATGWLTILFLGFCWSLWSVFHLGLRRSFLYAKKEDKLITTGPYRFQQHPQLFGALVTAYSSILALQPSGKQASAILIFRLANLMVMIVAVVIITRVEDNDLTSRFGEEYVNYRNQVSSFIGIRRKRALPSMGKCVFFVALPYVFSSLFFILMLSRNDEYINKNRLIFAGIDIHNHMAALVTQRDFVTLGYKIRDYIRENNVKPGDIPSDWVKEHWLEWDRLSGFSPYPQTLFYCDKVFYSNQEAESGHTYRFQGYNIVRELPFPLVCNKDQIEIAQAMDYDYDGFPQIWVLRYPSGDKNNFRQFDIYWAADDEDNVIFNSEFGARMKQKNKVP